MEKMHGEMMDHEEDEHSKRQVPMTEAEAMAAEMIDMEEIIDSLEGTPAEKADQIWARDDAGVIMKML